MQGERLIHFKHFTSELESQLLSKTTNKYTNTTHLQFTKLTVYGVCF